MTQLDLFSAAVPVDTGGELVSKKAVPAKELSVVNDESSEQINVQIETAEVVTDQIITGFSNSETKTATPNNITETPETDSRIQKRKTGNVVFEDSRISVKLKTRQSSERIDINKERSGTGLPALPEKPLKIEPKKSIVTKQPKTEYSNALREKLDSVKNSIKEGLLKDTQAEKKKKDKESKQVQKRGRKSYKELSSELDLIEVPEDEQLFKKQYYAISEVAGWFKVNTSLLRFWENEFDILKPRKNRKGDRMFRPEDVKSLQIIYELLRQRKYSIEGAKEFLKANRGKADTQMQLTNTLLKFKRFLLELKANLQ